jgi:type IV secretory pathway VirB10-like protein
MNDVPEHNMSPDASPGQLSKGAGVRRVNNVPLYLFGGAMATFLVIMASVAANRGQPDKPGEKRSQKAGSATMFANSIVGDQKDGIIPPAATPPAIPAPLELAAAHEAALAMARPENPDLPPAPPTSSQQQQEQGQPMAQGGMGSPAGDEAARIRTMKLQQLDEAVRAHSSVQVALPRGASASPATNAFAGTAQASRDDVQAKLAAVRQQIAAATANDPSEPYKTRLQLLPGGQVAGDSGESSASGPVKPGSARNDVARFAGKQGDRWRLDAQPEAPRTLYELRAGFVIPAILISGINSELPGQIMAQVSQDVYDTPRGKWKLIPQGSRLVGAYSSDVAFGQARVLVAWQRIVFPDGKAMDIGAMPGADSAGYAGFTDRVNNHYWRTFSSAFLMSAVTAGIATSQREGSGYGRPSFGSAMSEAVGQQLGQVTAQLIAKNLNTAPTLEIRPGYRFNVLVTKDMSFSKPYQSFDY